MLHLLNRSIFIITCLVAGCTTPPVTPTRQSEPPIAAPQRIEPPKPQVIQPKTASNALSTPTVKTQPKPSLGVVVANHKTLNGALVLRFDSFKGISPAENAGVRKGDIITWVGTCEVINVAAYFTCVEKFMPNQRVQIAFNRDDVIEKLWVKLGERY